MRVVQYSGKCESYVAANAKISRPKVNEIDFIKLTNLAKDINATHYLANNIQWGGITVPYSEIDWPKAFSGMIYPRAVTATGDIYTEADVLEHDFNGMIDLAVEKFETIDVVVKDDKGVEETEKQQVNVNEAEMSKQNLRFANVEEFNLFVNRLYGTFKKAPETEKVSDLRNAASLTSENVKRMYVTGNFKGVSGSMTSGLFPWRSKFNFKHEDEALRNLDKSLDDFLRISLQSAANN